MSEDQITASFFCRTCDSATELSLPDDYTDDSIASCKHCGQGFGTFGEVKAKAQSEAAAHLQAMVRDTFKGLKGWTIK